MNYQGLERKWHMNVIKPRHESQELKLLRYLNTRMQFKSNMMNHYLNQEKGFEGEEKFDAWISPCINRFLIINDLLLEVNNNVIQIDSLLIGNEKLYFFEVKNYEGDHFIESDNWYTIAGTEIKNPLHQLKRSEALLKRLLNELGFPANIEPYLIFVNPEFHLYQAPKNLPIIFPTQINRFVNQINKKPSYQTVNHQSKLVEKLLSLHLSESPYMRLPEYNYEQLKKGIVCPKCRSFTKFYRKVLMCTECGFKEEVDKGVLRSIQEIQILFPDLRIKTNTIHEWCKVVKSKKLIRKILNDNFTRIGHSRSSHYV